MKNFSKKKFPGKNNHENKRNSEFGDYSKKTNRSEKKERLLNNSSKNKNVENFNKNAKNKTFSSIKRRNPKLKSNTEFPNKNSDYQKEFTNKKNLMIGYGVNIPFMRLLAAKDRLIGFGVLRKFFLQTNSIFCLRILSQKEFLLKKFLGTDFRN